MAALADATVRCWGSNTNGQLGNPAIINYTSTPVAPAGTNVTNVVSVAAGFFHSLALKGDGTMWAWGINDG